MVRELARRPMWVAWVAVVCACGGEIDAGLDGGGGEGGGALYDQLSPDQQGLFDEVNKTRSQMGLSPVSLRADLICAAELHSDDIGSRGACTHTGADGSSPGDRVAACDGGGWTSEIVACGQSSPAAAVEAWLSSSGHRGIMLGASRREIGVAVTNNYWTAIFDD